MFGVKLGVLLLALTSVAVLPAGTAVNDHWYESVCVSVTGLARLQLVVPSVSVVIASRPMANPGATLLLVALPSVTVPVPVVTVCVAEVEVMVGVAPPQLALNETVPVEEKPAVSVVVSDRM